MLAIIALTKDAVKLGFELKESYPQADLFIPLRHKGEVASCNYIQDKFSIFIEKIWPKYTNLIFIMAAGIVVRSIAPLIRNKLEDPAVLVIDEKGYFVISLLAGHFGGANALAQEIAREIGGQAVITTASDVEGIPALDDLARRNCCIMENIRDLKDIAVALIEHKPVALCSTVKIKPQFPDNVDIIDDLEGLARHYQGVILITEKNKELGELKNQEIPYVILRPRNVIIGVGCRKGKSKDDILQAIQQTVEETGLNINTIQALATIELKKDEPGLVEAALELGVPLKWVKAQEIQRVEHNFPCSEFVKKQVGAGAVAEPAAYLIADNPLVVSEKRKFAGITTAVVIDKNYEII